MRKIILAAFFASFPPYAFAQIPPLTLYPTTADVILGTPCGSAGTPLWRAICSQDMVAVFSTANSWTAVQSFSPSIALNGATSGSITLQAPAVAGTNTITFPAGTTNFSSTGGANQIVKQTSVGGAFTVATLSASDMAALLSATNTWTATQTFATESTSLRVDSSSAPSVSSCGTSPSVTSGSTNSGGQFTTGSSGTPSGCTITFSNSGWPTNAWCTVSPVNSTISTLYISAQSKTAFTVATTAANSLKISYTCVGN
jgi:hypothetical protein